MKKYSLLFKTSILFSVATAFCSCASIPKGVQAVGNLDVQQYLGRWYDVARLDHSFEKNLSNTTAFYSKNSDGTLKVENKGFNEQKKQWTSATGKAHFVGSAQDGRLKVSFFGPFYGGYNVVWIDKDYQNALIYGGSTKYMWILSRKRSITKALKQQLISKASQDGVDTQKLIWVDQSKAIAGSSR